MNLLTRLKQRFSKKPLEVEPVEEIEEDEEIIELEEVGMGRIVRATKRPTYEPYQPHQPHTGGRVIKTMPRALRKVKEAQERVEDD